MQHNPAPSYGWLTGLAVYLNQVAGKGNWAFTGSFAMFCWAWMKDGKAREPEDIDILVAANKFENVAYGLNSKLNTRREPFSPPNPISAKARVPAVLQVGSGVPEQIQEKSIGIDVLNVHAGRFGNLDNIVFLNNNDHFPVVPIAELIQRKIDIRNDTGKSEEREKAEKDLAFLKSLQ